MWYILTAIISLLVGFGIGVWKADKVISSVEADKSALQNEILKLRTQAANKIAGKN